MALSAFLKLTGRKQGEIKGSVTQKGRAGAIRVIAVSHEIISPRDPASGLPTGTRIHKPIVITKVVDRSSPLLYEALAGNEHMSTWVLELLAPAKAAAKRTSKDKAGGGSGKDKPHYTITLTNAVVASVSFRAEDPSVPGAAGSVEHEEIAFTYEKIEWTWADGDVTASDTWQAPAGH
jgi:type VI secretion system secreted protein Hcp